MEFYKDESLFKNKEIKKTKRKYYSLKLAAIILALTFGPSTTRCAVNSIEKSNKEYELDQRDKMYDIIVERLKNIGITNSIMAVKFISNLINDGYLTIKNDINTDYYNIVDEYDYDTIIGNPTIRSNNEIIVKLINKLYNNVEAYNIKVNLKTKEDNTKTNYSSTYMCLICDRDLNVNYLYSHEFNEYIKVSSLFGFHDNYMSGNINYIEDLASGKYNILDFAKIKGNNNEDFHDVNFDIYKNYSDRLYENSDIILYEIDKLTTLNKINIEIKEKTRRIPE